MPDLVLLDVMMPGIDGFETCKRLKEDPRTKNIPVIFLTANTDTKNVVKGFSVGAVDYIGKPLQQEEVTARVRSHIAIRRLQRELQGEVVARRDAEESLREIEEDLRRANAEKDRKVSDLARELKVPISEIAELCGKLTSNLPETASPDLKAIVQALIDKTNMLEKTVLGRLEAS
jgi:DNA-binding response OmpR family regulator